MEITQLKGFLTPGRGIDQSKELYTGTPNSDIHILCTVHCGKNVNKPSAPTEVEGKGLQPNVILQSNKKQVNISSQSEYIWSIWKIQQQYIFIPTRQALFPQKWCVGPEFFCFDLLPLQYTDLTNEIWLFLVYIFLGKKDP